MPLADAQRQAFRALAEQTDGIDVEVYRRFGKDPLEPIIGLGDANAPIAFFGRDPGREEVRHGQPFVGSSGQSVRGALYRHRHGVALPDFEAALAVGAHYFWIATVPYKPVGNKAWSMAVKRRFHPLMRQLLVESWQGETIITLGREAFLWFTIDQPPAVRQQLEQFWRREDRFSASIEVELQAGDGAARRFRLYPLPHPSPLNQAWFKRFPALLEDRLKQLGV